MTHCGGVEEEEAGEVGCADEALLGEDHVGGHQGEVRDLLPLGLGRGGDRVPATWHRGRRVRR